LAGPSGYVAFVRNFVAVAVLAISVAVKLTFVENAVARAVLASSRGDLAFIRDTVAIAVAAGRISDVAFVWDSVAVAVVARRHAGPATGDLRAVAGPIDVAILLERVGLIYVGSIIIIAVSFAGVVPRDRVSIPKALGAYALGRAAKKLATVRRAYVHTSSATCATRLRRRLA
jgi:hypothetical protein